MGGFIVKFYKFVVCFFIVLFVLSFDFYVFADDLDFENDIDISSFVQSSSSIVTKPVINSRAGIVFDRNSGCILFGKNENEKRKMASTTKIMTAIIVLENANLNDIVTISQKSAGTGGSRLGLHVNDKVSVLNLLYGLLLCSGNDSAVALAEHVGGDVAGFATLMNDKCNKLNLTSTHFVTPHGLDDDNHYTTAYELAIITDYALKNPTFVNLVSTKTHTVSINGYSKTLNNTNELLGYLNGVYGVKTGFTNGANRCLVTSIKKDNMDLICIVLGADTKKDRTRDSIELIDYAFSNFKLFNIKEKVLSEFNNWISFNSNSFAITKGVSNSLDLKFDDLPYDSLPINCNYFDDVCIYIYCDKKLDSPLPANSIVGYISVSVNNEQIMSVNIRNVNEVEKKTYNYFFEEMLRNYVYHLESIFFY